MLILSLLVPFQRKMSIFRCRTSIIKSATRQQQQQHRFRLKLFSLISSEKSTTKNKQQRMRACSSASLTLGKLAPMVLTIVSATIVGFAWPAYFVEATTSKLVADEYQLSLGKSARFCRDPRTIQSQAIVRLYDELRDWCTSKKKYGCVRVNDLCYSEPLKNAIKVTHNRVFVSDLMRYKQIACTVYASNLQFYRMNNVTKRPGLFKRLLSG